MRPLHKLKSVTWTVVLRVTDTPGPGEDYLTADQIKEQMLKTGNLDAGVSFKFDSLVLDEES